MDKIERCQREKGWTFPRCSSYGSDVNYDFHGTLDESVLPLECDHRTLAEHEAAGTAYYFSDERPIAAPGASYFLRDGDRVFHTYSTYGRGLESTGGSSCYLDLTALGRQEDWKNRGQGRQRARRRSVVRRVSCRWVSRWAGGPLSARTSCWAVQRSEARAHPVSST